MWLINIWSLQLVVSFIDAVSGQVSSWSANLYYDVAATAYQINGLSWANYNSVDTDYSLKFNFNGVFVTVPSSLIEPTQGLFGSAPSGDMNTDVDFIFASVGAGADTLAVAAIGNLPAGNILSITNSGGHLQTATVTDATPGGVWSVSDPTVMSGFLNMGNSYTISALVIGTSKVIYTVPGYISPAEATITVIA